MSFSKFVGRCTLLGLVVFLFVKGALVLRPKETIAALSALIAALLHACCGASSAPEPSSQNRAALEERRERDLVRHRERDERSERRVRLARLQDADVLRVQSCDLGSLFLRQLTLLSELPKSKSKPALRSLEGRRQHGASPDLGPPMLSDTT